MCLDGDSKGMFVCKSGETNYIQPALDLKIKEFTLKGWSNVQQTLCLDGELKGLFGGEGLDECNLECV